MRETELILSLARVLIAAAWADGRVHHREINSLKDLLFRLPHLNEETWKRLTMYIDAPVDPDERRVLLDELRGQIRTDSDKQLVFSALDALIQADGDVTDDECRVLEEIREAIESVDTDLFSRLARAVGPRVRRRADYTATREGRFEDYLKNKVFYRVSQRAGEHDALGNLDETEQRKLCLAGALMARVAHVDTDVQQSEHHRIRDLLRKRWSIGPDAASFVADVALSEAAAQMDGYRATRRFFELTTPEERIRLIGALFAVAAADGSASHQEIEEIRSIATGLRLSHRQFIDVKVAVLG